MRSPGVPSFCCDVECFCFRCTAEELASNVCDKEPYSILGRGVYFQDAVVTQSTLRLVRYRESQWCAIAPVLSRESYRLKKAEVHRTYSQYARADALFLGIYDTAGGSCYKFVKNGCIVEEYVYSVEENERHAYSSWRSLDPVSFSYDHIDSFVRELGIIPPLFNDPFVKIGQKLQPLKDVDADWEEVLELIVLDKLS